MKTKLYDYLLMPMEEDDLNDGNPEGSDPSSTNS